MNHLLPNTLKEFRYYERKLPLYLRNDECFIEHFYLWYELLMGKGDENIAVNEFCGIAPTSDLLLLLLNIYDPDILTVMSMLKDANDNTDLLNKLGNLFGLRRSFSVDYYNEPTDPEPTHATLTLNDDLYLALIKAQIIRNYCNGTYEQAMGYYRDANLQIIVVNNDDDSATADCYLNDNGNLTDELKILFKAGYLQIEHVGIRYTYSVVPLLEVLVWSNDSGTKGAQTWGDNEGTTGGVFVV